MDVPPIDLLFARGTKTYVRHVVVAGRTIVSDGRLTGVNLDRIERDLRAGYRKTLPTYDGLVAAWPEIEAGMRDWMVERCGCC